MKHFFYFLVFGVLVVLNQSCHSLRVESFVLESCETGMKGTIRGIDVVDADVIWISGVKGQFCTSSDGGVNWTHGQVDGAQELDFRDVQGFSAENAVLMSAGPGDASRIYRTEDAGHSWTLSYLNPDSAGFFDGMDFNGDEGILFSDPVDDKLNLMFTKDGGVSWSRFHPELLPLIADGEYAFAASGSSIQYDPTGGIWLATGGKISRILHTVELGKPWTIWESPSIQGDPAEGLFSIAPRSAIRVVAVGGNYQKMGMKGSNVIRQRRVGEISWEIPSGSDQVPFMECVKWISNSSLIACGPPGVWISADNGQTWELISEPGFHALDVDEGSRTAWLAGDKGAVCQIKW